MVAFGLIREDPAGLPETVYPHWEADRYVRSRPVHAGTCPSRAVRSSPIPEEIAKQTHVGPIQMAGVPAELRV